MASPLDDTYETLEQLGKGAFGIVKRVRHKETGKLFAVKIIAKSRVNDLSAIRQEISIMKRVDHPAVIKLVEVFETDTDVYMVLELVSGGELFDRIVEREKYSEADAADLVRQTLTGLRYLHGMNIVHRDMKPENLLLSSMDSDCDVKIADFGLSTMVDTQKAVLQTGCGTPDYVAPEVLDMTGYGQKVDLWAMGVITYILLCGYPPFYDENLSALLKKVQAAEYEFFEEEWGPISNEAKDFISKLLQRNPEIRLSAEQALEHPWVSGSASSTPLPAGTGEKIKAFNARRKLQFAVKLVSKINQLGRIGSSRSLELAAAAAAAKKTSD